MMSPVPGPAMPPVGGGRSSRGGGIPLGLTGRDAAITDAVAVVRRDVGDWRRTDEDPGARAAVRYPGVAVAAPGGVPVRVTVAVAVPTSVAPGRRMGASKAGDGPQPDQHRGHGKQRPRPSEAGEQPPVRQPMARLMPTAHTLPHEDPLLEICRIKARQPSHNPESRHPASPGRANHKSSTP